MSLYIIEIDDIGLALWRDGELIEASPGVALVGEREILTGSDARARQHLEPRFVHDRYWQQLGEAPLAEGGKHCRHFADLAWHHLRGLLERAGKPAEAILAVPAHYTNEQLSLLAGIAASLDLSLGGLVDAGVAALAGCAPAGRYRVARLYAHHATIVDIDVGTDVERVAIAVVDPSGRVRLDRAVGDLVADALLDQARFDPLHEAATEQQLYDRLDDWMLSAAVGAEVEIVVEHRGTRYAAHVASAEFERAVTMVLAPLAEALRGDRQVVLDARCAILPGMGSRLPQAAVLAPDAVWRGISEHRLSFTGAGDALSYRTALPASREPGLDLPAPALADAPTVTHLLCGSHAYALGPRVAGLGRAGFEANPAPGMPSVTRRGAEAVLDPGAARVYVNGAPIDAARTLGCGDTIEVDHDGARFLAIHAD